MVHRHTSSWSLALISWWNVISHNYLASNHEILRETHCPIYVRDEETSLQRNKLPPNRKAGAEIRVWVLRGTEWSRRASHVRLFCFKHSGIFVWSSPVKHTNQEVYNPKYSEIKTFLVPNLASPKLYILEHLGYIGRSTTRIKTGR